MSVGYSAKLGYGFLIDSNECCSMPDEKYEQLVDSEFFTTVDSYCDNPLIFFGLIMFNLDPGEAASIPVVRQYDHDKFSQMMDEYKDLFPNRKGFPRDYLLACVN